MPNIIKVPIDHIRPNPFQPETRINPPEEVRKKFGLSILKYGMYSTPFGRIADTPEYYEMGDGWQRLLGYRWAVENGHQEYAEIAFEVRELTDRQMADVVMEANLVRKDLNPIELAQFYAKYLERFNVPQSKLAERHNCSQGEIANKLRLLDLPPDVQQRIITQEITSTHGRSLLQLKDKKLMSEYAAKAVENNWNVATLDAVIKTYLDSQKPRMVEPAPAAVAPSASPKSIDNGLGLGWVCRVCGCTDDEACVTEEGACFWLEKNLCSACGGKKDASLTQQTKPMVTTSPPVSQMELETKAAVVEMAEKAAEQVKEKEKEKLFEQDRKFIEKLQKKSETPKPSASAPAAPAATAPAPVKTNWGRKLVIEEKDDQILMSCMKAGGMPEFQKYKGSFHEAIVGLLDWVIRLEAQWSKEGK